MNSALVNLAADSDGGPLKILLWIIVIIVVVVVALAVIRRSR